MLRRDDKGLENIIRNLVDYLNANYNNNDKPQPKRIKKRRVRERIKDQERKRYFIHIVEFNRGDNKTYHYYLLYNINKFDFQAMKKSVVNLEGFQVYLEKSSIMEIEAKEKQSLPNEVFKRLIGRLQWKSRIETILYDIAKQRFPYEFFRNCQFHRSYNDNYFEPFNIPPKKYMYISQKIQINDPKKTQSRTIVQYNGNEDELKKLFDLSRNDPKISDNFIMDEMTKRRTSDHSIIGAFSLDRAIKKFINSNRDLFTLEVLRNGGIHRFIS